MSRQISLVAFPFLRTMVLVHGMPCVGNGKGAKSLHRGGVECGLRLSNDLIETFAILNYDSPYL